MGGSASLFSFRYLGEWLLGIFGEVVEDGVEACGAVDAEEEGEDAEGGESVADGEPLVVDAGEDG